MQYWANFNTRDWICQNTEINMVLNIVNKGPILIKIGLKHWWELDLQGKISLDKISQSIWKISDKIYGWVGTIPAFHDKSQGLDSECINISTVS